MTVIVVLCKVILLPSASSKKVEKSDGDSSIKARAAFWIVSGSLASSLFALVSTTLHPRSTRHTRVGTYKEAVRDDVSTTGHNYSL